MLVSRELLKRAASRLWADGNYNTSKELRALLDAPEVLVVPLTGPKEWLDSLKPAAQPQGEPVAQGVGVLTFMRSTSEDASRCACCEGEHVFCRYFKGLPDFNDLTENLRHRNDLEGREFRVTVEALPLYAEQPAPVAEQLIERLAKRFPDLENMYTAEAFADWLRAELNPSL